MNVLATNAKELLRVSRYVGTAGFGVLSLLLVVILGLDQLNIISAPVPPGLLIGFSAVCFIFAIFSYRYPRSQTLGGIVAVTFVVMAFIASSRGGVYSAAGVLIPLLALMVSVSQGQVFAGLAYSAAAIAGLYVHPDALEHEAAPRLILTLLWLPVVFSVLLRSDITFDSARMKALKLCFGLALGTSALLALVNNFPVNSLVSLLTVAVLLAYLWRQSELSSRVSWTIFILWLALASFNSFGIGSAFSAAFPMFVLVCYLIFSTLAALASVILLAITTVIGISFSEAAIDGALILRTVTASVVITLGLHIISAIRSKDPMDSLSLETLLTRSGLLAAGFGIAALLTVLGLTAAIDSNQKSLSGMQSVRYHLINLEKLLIDRETGQRGYLLTGDSRFLEPYETAKGQIGDLLASLESNLSPDEYSRLTQAIKDRGQYYEQTLQTVDREGFENALTLVRSGKGKAYTDMLREIIETTTSRLADEIEKEVRFITRINIAFDVAMALLVTLILVTGAHLRTRFRSLVFRPLANLTTALTKFGENQSEAFPVETQAVTELRSLSKSASQMGKVIQREQAALRHAVRELREEKEKQAQMLSVISHELRTPLASSQMIYNELNADSLDGYLPTLKANGENVLAIMNDLKMVVRPDAIPEREQSDEAPLSVVERTLLSLSNLASQHGYRTHLTSDDLARRLMHFNTAALRQIVTNLTKNAFLHANGSNVWISLSAEQTSDTVALVTVRIEDDGRGISKEFQTTMFEAFSRGDTTADGTGLGLYIIKQLADSLAGHVSYFDSEQGGAGFSVVARLALANEQVNNEAWDYSEDELNQTLQDKRVLFAEDQLTIQKLTELLLKKAGASAWVCDNGQDAIEQFEETAPDIVITDAMMPVIDGYQLCKALRERGYKGPIIAVTAATIGDEAERLMQAGADAVMPKPINIDALKRELANWAKA
jgi:signal transduction histidine kinase/CheY-like chemotaxis protein